MGKENILGTEDVSTLLKKFATPSVIAMIVSAFYNIVDQFFIGHSVGVLGNAATNVAFPLVTICISLSLMIGVGAAANFNLNMGKKREDLAKKYLANAFIMIFLIGLILMILVKIFLEPMLRAFGTTDDIMDYAKTYTTITSTGFIFLILTNAGTALIRADGSPSYSMTSIVIGCIINIILDPLFIFVFNMGMAGAAWATVIGQFVSGLMVIFYARNFKTVELNREDFRFEFPFVKNIVSLGMAPFFNQVALLFVQIVINNSIAHYGPSSVFGASIPLAVIGIGFKINMIFFSCAIGISQGLQPIASYNYGARLYERVKSAYILSVKVSMSILFAAFLLFQIFPEKIISLFGDGTKEYFEFGKLFFRIFLMMITLNALQPLTSNLLSSIGKPKKGIFLSLTRQFLFFIPLALILPMFFGIYGILFSGPIADFFAFLFAVFLAKHEFRQMDKLEHA